MSPSAGLRRCESLSEKQVKEAKSKCKRIALLLTAAPPNPNNKGVLMFKKHRQRAKKYTLVSYGTGEDEPESTDEEDEEDGEDEERCTLQFTLVATSPTGIDIPNSRSVLAVSLDRGLLEIERNLKNRAEMECLPETKGKGALMFAQRRQRMDEIAAEHEELRRHGIPVEGVQEAEKDLAENPYMQPAVESHVYMDVSAHQQSQQQQFQQYHQQQQIFQQQQQEYRQDQQIHYAPTLNGSAQQQTGEPQHPLGNRTAKPFSVESMAAIPYAPAVAGFQPDPSGQGEQIASRDERIATPAIKTGVLMEGRKRSSGKPMFTFKEPPKVSPNPALLNLLNRGDKKLGFESGPEEDYLSLGAEACNFLQSSLKHKNPPPVAPKPVVNPSCLPWTTQPGEANQAAQQAENSLSTPAAVPLAEPAPASEPEPAPAPVPQPSPPPPAPQGVSVSTTTTTTTMDANISTLPEAEAQDASVLVSAQEDYGPPGLTQPPQTTWAVAQIQPQQQQQQSAHPWVQVQPQEPAASQSPSQPPWVSRQAPQAPAQPPTLTNTWSSPNQTSWNPPQEQAPAPAHTHPTWSHPQEQTHAQPPWAQPQPPNVQPAAPVWGQQQQPQTPWVQPPQPQPPWMQPQQKVQAQPPWGQQVQQQRPPWVQQQQQHQAPHPEWAQEPAPGQPPAPWLSAQSHQAASAWPPSQPQGQVQPPWVQPTPAQASVQPGTSVSPWTPLAQPQPPWAQSSEEPAQPSTGSWAKGPSPTPQRAVWAGPVPAQTNWSQQTPTTPQQQPTSPWASPQTQPQAAVDSWTPHSQPAGAVVNTRPCPKPWSPAQSHSHPAPPQRLHAFTAAPRAASPINPMATVLNPASQSSSVSLPAVRGKGADMFVKRQSRMEKFVVDSQTVEANKASRSASPAASLPNEWKYTPNVRAPPSRAYNPIQSPFYPPAAAKQPPSGSPSIKAKSKGKQKEAPPPKPLSVVDVMKHQPYQLNSSLFIFGPAVEAEKSGPPKAAPPPPHPPVEQQPVRYEQAPLVQADGPYPQQGYGTLMSDGPYQPNPTDIYPPPSPYQQPPLPYPQYQQPLPPAYCPQTLQSPMYQNPPQAPYQPASSPPYLATPAVAYQPQAPGSYAGPAVALATKAESISGGSAAPKPKFTAKKSSAQIWKPTAADQQ